MCEHSRTFDEGRWRDFAAACATASQAGALLVPGIEYNDPDNVVHIPVWGDLPFFGQTPAIGGLLESVSAAGGAAVFAHPWRRNAWQRFDPAWAPHLVGVEVWNRKYDGWAPNRGAIELAAGRRLDEFASLDFHTWRQFFPLSMTLEINGGLTVAAVWEALQAGRFRASFFGRPLGATTVGGRLTKMETLERGRRFAAPYARRLTRSSR
jgi:hypothetical protein